MLKPQLISTLLSIKPNRETIHLLSYHFLSYLETTHSDLGGFKNPRKVSVFKITKTLTVGLYNYNLKMSLLLIQLLQKINT